MNLQYVSITGADDEVEIDDLSALAKTFPFVEWAILFMPSVAGTNRFPTTGWIENFKSHYTGNHTAMHLCGDAFLGFLAKDPAVLDLMKGFKRIQLNLKFGDVDGRYDTTELVERVKASPEWTFILQYTEDKAPLLPLFKDVPNHAVLFDASAGQGLCPQSWPAPISGHFCGYAGGLNPDNIKDNIEKISALAGDTMTWIDMETGIRTNDRFDLAKVRRVLKIAKPYA